MQDVQTLKYFLLFGDCLKRLKELADNSVDAVCCDPPYGISFMGKKWDYDIPSVEVWVEVMRVLKPGGHMLCACGTRTNHRMVCNIEDAGFQIFDSVCWFYGSGFPKSLNIGKAIDKCNGDPNRLENFVKWMRGTGMKQGQINSIIEKKDVGSHYLRLDQPAIPTAALWAKLRPHIDIEVPVWVDELVDRIEAEREVVGKHTAPAKSIYTQGDLELPTDVNITAPATEAAKQWDGWGTALKPAFEFFTMARKPLSEKTIVANVLRWGTGGINIDGCLVATDGEPLRVGAGGIPCRNADGNARQGERSSDNIYAESGGTDFAMSPGPRGGGAKGRWPANLLHDGSPVVVDGFPVTKSGAHSIGNKAGSKSGLYQHGANGYQPKDMDANQGSAARFFYCAKASKADRDEGLEGLVAKRAAGMAGNMVEGQRLAGNGTPIKTPVRKNTHPTVKPTELMRYLCRLITPPGGTVLDPYMGSGSTGKAAALEGFKFTGIELDAHYFDIATRRIKHANHRLF